MALEPFFELYRSQVRWGGDTMFLRIRGPEKGWVPGDHLRTGLEPKG